LLGFAANMRQTAAFWTNSCSSCTISPQFLQEEGNIVVKSLQLAVILQGK
jgi:hypothetical protein